MPLKEGHLLLDTILRCHMNMPAQDVEKLKSLPLPSAFLLIPKFELKGI